MAQAYPFSKGTNPKDVLTSILKADVSRSVGLIYVEGQPCGTGFRVGSKYIITCAHVLTEVRGKFYARALELLILKHSKWLVIFFNAKYQSLKGHGNEPI